MTGTNDTTYKDMKEATRSPLLDSQKELRETKARLAELAWRLGLGVGAGAAGGWAWSGLQLANGTITLEASGGRDNEICEVRPTNGAVDGREERRARVCDRPEWQARASFLINTNDM